MNSHKSEPKSLESITLSDLENHRWCYYENPDLGYDAFEHAIPDTHPDFSIESLGPELAIFYFQSGDIQKGIYDGSESYCIKIDGSWIYLWYGIRIPPDKDIQYARSLLHHKKLVMPVKAITKWSKKERVFNGIEYFSGTISI